ncbi:MAG TPA: LuxR C-terminal-related transcriptional regulator, partial [Gaiellaceae bacterium]|nr:LuxR C-terminal-related transcriptional regulator [Gaiellaceae bacterium]
SDLSQREIAQELYLSHNTVKTHSRNLYRKLGVGTRDEAVRRAVEVGLLTPPGARREVVGTPDRAGRGRPADSPNRARTYSTG